VPANKLNYIVVYPNDAQLYGATKKDIALASPAPEGCELKDKRVFFVSMEPENKKLVWYRIPQEEVDNAEIVYPKTMKGVKEALNEQEKS
jgi:hypothetical protein